MPKKFSGVNAKSAAGRERKAEHKAQKAAEEARKLEQQEAREWQKGANVRGQARAEAAAAKADEAARKRREKEELLKQEEAELAGAGGKPKKTPTLSKGKKKKKQNDLTLLEDALVSNAEKKSKAKKRLEQEKQQEQQQKRKAAEATAAFPAQDPLLQNTEDMIGGDAGRSLNIQQEQAGASGIDAALDNLNVSSPEKKSQKALYREFEERMLPQVKEEYSGLRLTQYKEKVWALWKKSPENPMNQQSPSSS